MKDTRENCDQNISIMVVGNKSDLKKERAITYDEGLSLCKHLKTAFCETSCITGQNSESLFFEISKMILHKIEIGALQDQDFKPKYAGFLDVLKGGS